MGSDKILVSFCIPTNGIIEWVIPVLDSIYKNIDKFEDFEVIVTDNGNNKEFENKMNYYKKKYSNFIYKKTTAKMFLNQIEAFKLSKGELIKFINHRMELLPNSVNYLINFVRNNIERKPVIYFSNGNLKQKEIVKEYKSFDEFVKGLSYWSSWSAGTTMWKEDLEKLENVKSFNNLFPHTDIIFSNKNKDKYIIDNTVLVKELIADNTKKGNYDLFNAFAIEYPSIIYQLYCDGYISKKTFKTVKKDNSYFLSRLYIDYIIKKNKCSYDLGGYCKSIGKYYSDLEIKCKVFIIILKKILLK